MEPQPAVVGEGKTSGHYQIVKEVIADCDYDAPLIKAEQQGRGPP